METTLPVLALACFYGSTGCTRFVVLGQCCVDQGVLSELIVSKGFPVFLLGTAFHTAWKTWQIWVILIAESHSYPERLRMADRRVGRSCNAHKTSICGKPSVTQPRSVLPAKE